MGRTRNEGPFSVPLNTTRHASGPLNCAKEVGVAVGLYCKPFGNKTNPCQKYTVLLIPPQIFSIPKNGGRCNQWDSYLLNFLHTIPHHLSYSVFAWLNYCLLNCRLATPTANWNVSSEREGIFFVKAVSSLGKTIPVLGITNKC